jgi:hypothetical protein
MPPGPQVVLEAANVLVVQQADDGSLAGIAVLPRSIGTLPIFSARTAVVGRNALDDLAGNLDMGDTMVRIETLEYP